MKILGNNFTNIGNNVTSKIGTSSINKVAIFSDTTGNIKDSGFTIEKSVPSDAVFTDTLYTHPTSDGNKHVPATGTSNNGKFLKAGSSAGALSWETITANMIGAAPTVHTHQFTDVTNKPTGLAGQAYYLDSDNNENIRPSYILYEGTFAETSQELAEAKQKTINFAEIFNTWHRFSHNTSTSQPANASELNNWTYDATNNLVKCTINSATHIGFVSTEKYDNYIHECTLKSTDTDNDAIAVVIAFTTDSSGKEHTLTLLRARSVEGHFAVAGTSYRYAIIYNFLRSDAKMIASKTVAGDSDGGWNAVTNGTIVRIERKGDIIKAWTGAHDATSIDSNTLLSIDLNSDPLLTKFRGAQQYGYSCMSQNASTFSNIYFSGGLNNAIYDLLNNQVWTHNGTTWVLDSNKNLINDIGIGRLIYDKNTKKMFFIKSADEIINVGTSSSTGSGSTGTIYASTVVQDANNRFITDTERSAWNGKASTSVVTTSANGLMIASDKSKLDGIATSANNYTHPSLSRADTTSSATTSFGGKFTVIDSLTTNSSGHVSAINVKTITMPTIANATTIANGLMSNTDKTKLDGIAASANNYSHPSTHPASMISQDASNRFVSDSEKTTWNAKASTATATTSANGLMTSTMVTKLDGIATGANNYAHPSTHPASIITQDANNRFVTDTEKSNWNGKASTAVVTTSANGLMIAADKTKLNGIATGANNYTHPTGAGNNHIPTGGAANQFLKYSASGTAVWAAIPTTAWASITEKPAISSGSGSNSIVLGVGSATGNYSFTQGANATASGVYSSAQGYYTLSRGIGSHSEGWYCISDSVGSHAEGKTSVALTGDHLGGYEISSYSATAIALYSTPPSGVKAGTLAIIYSEDIVEHGALCIATVASVAGNVIYLNSMNLNLEDYDPFWVEFIQTNAYSNSTYSGGNHAEGAGTISVGWSSHSEGAQTIASGDASHAEGLKSTASGYCSHSEGYLSKALGSKSHAEGDFCTASGNSSHAEGCSTTASGVYSHTEGYGTTAHGQASHAEGYRATIDKQIAYGRGSHVEGVDCVAGKSTDTSSSVIAAHAEGYKTTASGAYSHTEGYNTAASGTASHAEGRSNTASGVYSHAEGYGTTASGSESHAEGEDTIASGNVSHAEGCNNTASGYCSHVEGEDSTASGNWSHGEGGDARATGNFSHAQNYLATAQGFCQTAIGYANVVQGSTTTKVSTDAAFIIGSGTSGSSRANAFRVTWAGATYAKAAYSSTGADYAEMFEWSDGNADNKERLGYFVTFDNNSETIRIANDKDDYILGVVSCGAAILGDNHDEEWNDKYLRDKWGRIQYEKITTPTKYNRKKEKVLEECTMEVPILNPDYNPDKEYISRENRKEWSPIGMLGKLLVYEDGTCEVGGYCAPNENGIATKSDSGYRVMSKKDGIVKILFK